MRSRSPRVLLVVCAAAAALILAAPAAPASQSTASTAPPCPQPGEVLYADRLPPGLSAVACDLIGRIVHGDRAGAAIPVPGEGVEAFADGDDGSWEELTVATSQDGVLSVAHSKSTDGVDTPDTTLADNGCSDIYQPPITTRATTTVAWYFNLASKPSDLSQDVYAHVRAAANNVSNVRNNCGVADGSAYSQRDAGTTTRNPNINNTPSCTTRDGYNVTGFGSIDASGILAYACRWYTSGRLIEGDEKFDKSGRSWTLSPSTSCVSRWDVQSVGTHEHGHIAGMEHANETDHPWLTMSTQMRPCQTSERTFARGESNAWNAFY